VIAKVVKQINLIQSNMIRKFIFLIIDDILELLPSYSFSLWNKSKFIENLKFIKKNCVICFIKRVK